MTETFVDKIFESIQEDIISNRLLPGQRLHIAQLAEQYNVGSGPIREALSRLLATELVVTISQKGFRVASISQADLNDIYKTRAYIESLALRLSIENGNDEWEANILAAYHRLSKFELEHKIKNTDDYKEWENRHRGFNLALINACNLQYLLRIQSQLYNLTERYRRQWLMAGIKQTDGLHYAKEQKRIMDAALARNVETAAKLLYKHYENAVKVIKLFFIENHLFNQ
ncbi:MAG: FCD domain-containing protein [Gammaproteobacteria bacterium]|nr:FCD domain-containing protein [Gammaproteobacteria bacterium]MCW5583099.1 FCD domain-containing protein [Gammaproteobacteria bacterium]